MSATVDESFDLATTFAEGEREGTQSYPPQDSTPLGKITVLAVAWFNNVPTFQKGTARINLDPADLSDNVVNNISLKHIVIPITEEYEVLKTIFKDTGPSPPTSNTPTLAEQTLSSSKYLSGVRFYSTSDQFKTTFAVTNAFNKTFVANPAYIDGSQIGVNDLGIPYNGSDEGWAYATITDASTFVVTDKVLTLNKSGVLNLDAEVGVRGQDPFGNQAYQYSSSADAFLINTKTASSTATLDNFVDENYRLADLAWETPPGSQTGNWTSTDALTNGNAQVIGKLVYPQTNYSTGYKPTQTPDYSAFSGDQKYLRSFYTADPKQGGTLRIPGITLSDLGVSCDVHIRMPSTQEEWRTDWLDLSEPYNSGKFTGKEAEGEYPANIGCRISSTGNDFVWTCGFYSTFYCDGLAIVRIGLKTAPEEVTAPFRNTW